MFVIVTFIPLLYCFSGTVATHYNNHNERIIGGNDISIEKAPYQASVQYRAQHYCGGSIIAPSYVVSVAHCTTQRGMTIEDITVRVGTTTRDSGGQVITIKAINNHPNYDKNTADYDITVLELSTSLEFDSTVAAIALPSVGQSWPLGTEVLITGWGLTEQGGTALPFNLQEVNVELIDQESCSAIYESYGVTITERMFCAGLIEGGKDSCQNDSGGPLVVDSVLAGVIALGIGCGTPNFPTIYTNVTVVLDFLKENFAAVNKM